MRLVLTAVIVAMLAAIPAASAVDLGGKVDNVTFKDIRFLPRTLDDLGEPKAYVLAFYSNTCPLAQRYMPKLQKLHEEYGDEGVAVVGVNAGVTDTIMDMAKHAIEYDITFPVVKDMDGSVCKALGITRTPEIAILDGDRTFVYRGRVDDQYRLGGLKPEPSRDDLGEALKEVLAGNAVSVPETKAEGCSITYPSVPEPAETSTYHEHIAPIVLNNCTTCHRPESSAPFTLNSYRKVAGRAAMIEEVVTERRMPPWYAHPDHGQFLNNRRLADEDITLIRQWIAGGKVEGDPEKAPEPPVFSDSEWRIEHDVVIHAAREHELPATGFVPYQYVLMPYEFEQDTWVEGIEIRGSNPRVIHHANLFYTTGVMQFDRESNFLTGHVPGGVPVDMSDGLAMFIPKGARLGLQVHYVTTGKPEKDRPMLALRFAKSPVKKKIYYDIFDARPLVIPPHTPALETVEENTIDHDVHLLGLFTHMHLRGKDSTFVAHYPDGTTETLLSIPNFNFDWQIGYTVEPFTWKVPAGTRIENINHFDNSAFNPYNPAPDTEVRYGPQTVDEMSQGFIFFTRADEDLHIPVDPETGYAKTEVAKSDVTLDE